MACFSYYNNNQLIKVGKTIFCILKPWVSLTYFKYFLKKLWIDE
jgi:hypothetical protein